VRRPRTAAILPVKRFERAKGRLAPGLPDGLRGELARAMASDVLAALAGCELVERTIVVSGERSLPLQAMGGVEVLEDEDESGQSAAVAAGIERALAQGAERALCIPGDCPALDASELDALLGGAREREQADAEVVIVPDRHGTGTNGLLLSPPRAIAPAFGPGSCARHIGLARGAGVRHRIARMPSLQLDIDTAADLEALVAALTTGGRAAHTRELLARAVGSGVPAGGAAAASRAATG
jgi:2-phospho-L-lactate/phosphoenolpyruvate guanylyltransferase